MKLKVEVTAEDIALGGHINCDCPLQRATVRALSGVPVRVFCEQMEIGRHYFPLPVQAERWLRDYDCGRRSEPITFELEFP